MLERCLVEEAGLATAEFRGAVRLHYNPADECSQPARDISIARKTRGDNMDIFRGPQTGRSWKRTDSKKPRSYIKHWKPGDKISFNGTIDGALRFTELGIQIEEADVIALFNALVKNYRREQSRLGQELTQTRKQGAELLDALGKIYRLLQSEGSDSPSSETLDAARIIANHYRYPPNKGKPTIKGLKYQSI